MSFLSPGHLPRNLQVITGAHHGGQPLLSKATATAGAVEALEPAHLFLVAINEPVGIAKVRWTPLKDRDFVQVCNVEDDEHSSELNWGYPSNPDVSICRVKI